MAKRQIIDGGFQDALGNPLALGYLKFRLNTDAVTDTSQQIVAGRVVQVDLDMSGDVMGSNTVLISTTAITSNVLTIASLTNITALVAVGNSIVFPASMISSWLSSQTVVVLSVAQNGLSFTASFTHANYAPTAESSKSYTIGAAVSLWPTDQLTPTDTVYVVKAFSAAGQPAWESEITIPSGGSAYSLG